MVFAAIVRGTKNVIFSVKWAVSAIVEWVFVPRIKTYNPINTTFLLLLCFGYKGEVYSTYFTERGGLWRGT